LISVRSNKAELNDHSLRPDQFLISYVQREIPPGNPSLWDKLVQLGILSDFVEEGESQAAIKSRFDFAREALGPLASNKYLYDYLVTKLHSTSLSLESLLVTTELTSLRGRINRMRQFIQSHADSFEVFVALNNPSVTHKVWRLVELLNWANSKTDNLQAVIFAERRDIVKALAWLLPRLESAGWMKCASIVGHGNSDDSARGMPVNAQKTVVHDFRAGTCNILVASSVAEEGLDFQSLSVVVKFDGVCVFIFYYTSNQKIRQRSRQL
jgi:endoribonuclease Dicer